MGDVIPVVITVFEDRTFDFEVPHPAPRRTSSRRSSSSRAVPPCRCATRLASLTDEQLTKIAEIKMPDLNANDIEAAKKIVAGTARSMGVTIAE